MVENETATWGSSGGRVGEDAPGHTDLMVTPEGLDEWLKDNLCECGQPKGHKPNCLFTLPCSKALDNPSWWVRHWQSGEDLYGS
jgi:hypothetical protein